MGPQFNTPSPDASWTLEPGPLGLLAFVTAVYLVRWWRADRHAGRLVLFLAGVGCLVAALVSPIDRLGEQVFAMHMVQHVLLLDIAPILMLLGTTKVLLRPVTRRLLAIERAAGPLASPWFAVVLYVAVMWVWHVPALYDAAVEQPVVHALEHLLFAAAGGLYWWHLLSPLRSRLRLGGMAPVVYMASTKLLVGLLGVALTFAPESIYAVYERQPDFWGLQPGDDQALAGLVMALEQSVVMGIALAYLFVRALSESEREEERAERYSAA